MPDYDDKEINRLEIRNYLDETLSDDLSEDVSKGLRAPQKYLSSKYFYDTRGSHLFEEICLLPEYYPTRTEMSILKEHALELISSFQNGDLVELGSGGNAKIRILLDALDEQQRAAIRYIPVDVSESILVAESEELLDIYPELNVLCLVADFTQHMEIISDDRKKLITFFGSTIGNFDEQASHNLLNNIAQSLEAEDHFLIGLDMIKDKDILEAAYNDSKGITAEFNKNVLNVLNQQLHANFNPDHFDHVAFFNEDRERVEMHLRANQQVTVEIADLQMHVRFEKEETIHTEICRKFTKEKAEKMFDEAGLHSIHWFTDSNEWFSLVELKSAVL